MTSQPSAADIAYMQAHIDDDRRINVILAEVIPYALAVGAILLRLLARYKKGLSLGPDDYWILGTLIPSTAYLICTILMVHYGLGRHVILVTDIKGMSIATVAAEICYAACIGPMKISLLYLYHRVFPSKTLERISIALGIFVLLYSIAQMMAFGFECIPFQILWTGEAGTCIDVALMVTVFSVMNVLSDLVIILMPIPFLWNLKVTRGTRAALLFTFALGGVTIAFSIVRTIFLKTVSLQDATWSNVEGSFYSSLEVNIGIIAACLPTLRPIFFPVKQPANASSYHQKGSSHNRTPVFEMTPSSPRPTDRSGARTLAGMVSQRNSQGWSVMDEMDPISYGMKEDPRLSEDEKRRAMAKVLEVDSESMRTKSECTSDQGKDDDVISLVRAG